MGTNNILSLTLMCVCVGEIKETLKDEKYSAWKSL